MLDSWLKVVDPNFINAELIGPVGTEKVVTITDIDFAEAFNAKTNAKEQKISVFFEECKPMILNKTNAKMLQKLFGGGVDDPSLCVGKKITLYVVETKVGRNMTTGIRIKEYSETLCDDCKQPIKAIKGKTVAELVEISKRNTGRCLCIACMKKVKEEQEANE